MGIEDGEPYRRAHGCTCSRFVSSAHRSPFAAAASTTFFLGGSIAYSHSCETLKRTEARTAAVNSSYFSSDINRVNTETFSTSSIVVMVNHHIKVLAIFMDQTILRILTVQELL
ncbi:uncharacterized protein LOC111040153 [Myzus persicae]|uniref:uncharacterized protein LOC111040153 n=1 Tax=Myzus persicae TaxID=13164 RepID=UPI000B93714B|nr:uncharacterized protein LOC111040153 [Myzus persicae]